MKLNWNAQVSAFVRARLDALLGSDEAGSEDECRAARTTNALPVYFDMGGVLAFTPEGVVLSCDWESKQVRPETDEKWIIAAALSAAERYPELGRLVPGKPPAAKTCEACSGTGRMLQTRVLCRQCSGLGWK
jgi:hypothetical protein